MEEWDFVAESRPEKWAEHFIRTLKENPNINIDEGFMIGWFANALEAGKHFAIYENNYRKVS